MTAQQFRALMETVARGWRTGDARLAADCFAEDAIYSEPPDRQLYRGRKALFEFFGGAAGPERPMRMEWHHLVFDEAQQVGAGEYTFELNRRYHGIVLVRIRDGVIASWREYQHESPLDWSTFVGEHRF